MRLLFIGDAGTPSGFSQVSGALLPRWQRAGYDIAILGVDYVGDPNPLASQYRMYPAHLGGDYMGVGRVTDIVAREQPDRIVILNDSHVVASYMQALDPAWHSRVLAYVPVDGVGLHPSQVTPLNTAGAIVAYTEFGLAELQAAELDGPILAVIPHGINRDIFSPGDQAAARRACGIPPGAFVVLAVNRNQPRKALWLTMQVFKLFLDATGANAHLIYHGDIDDHAGGPMLHWARQFGIVNRFHYNKGLKASRGVAPAELANLYRAADVQISTTRGEGWGLTPMEGMACGLAQMIPDWGALAEWAGPAAASIPCYPWYWPHDNAASMGKVINPGAAATTLATLYRDSLMRAAYAADGLALVQQARYDWDTIADQFLAILATMPVQAGAE